MRYLGLDVHTKATVWHLLDRQGQTVETGKTATTGPALTTLVRRFADQDELLVGQEVGKMAYLVHDVLTAAKVRVLAFNAWHLRMVASSRKKTDRRDAYWLAKILQTGMMPHPVYIPTGEVRELRGLLSRRVAIVGERKRWLLRARSHLEAAGCPPQRRGRSITRLLESSLAAPDGLDATVADSVDLCQRMHATLTAELARVEGLLHEKAKAIDAVQRLLTIPAVGERVALTVPASVKPVTRSRRGRCGGNDKLWTVARCLGAYTPHVSTSTSWALLAAGLSLAACSGKTIGTDRTVEPPSYGGGSNEAGASDSGGAGGAPASGGASAAGGAGAPPDAGTRCDFVHPTCGGDVSYIELGGGGTPTRLVYPMDSSCGACDAQGCELWAFARSGCGAVSLKVAACAGPNGGPPCLDTVTFPGTFVDVSGQRFDGALLYTQDRSVTPNAAGVLDFDAIFSFPMADGTSAEIVAHVHVCGDVVRLAIPC